MGKNTTVSLDTSMKSTTPNEKRSSVANERLLMAMKKQVPTFATPQRVTNVSKRTSPLKPLANSHSRRTTIGDQLLYDMEVGNEGQAISTRSRVVRVELDSSEDDSDDDSSSFEPIPPTPIPPVKTIVERIETARISPDPQDFPVPPTPPPLSAETEQHRALFKALEEERAKHRKLLEQQ